MPEDDRYQWTVYRDDPSYMDIDQGDLQNCWYVLYGYFKIKDIYRIAGMSYMDILKSRTFTELLVCIIWIF